MNHYPEYILELFVRNSPDSDRERDAISHHLETCAGCRELAEEIREFYNRLEDSKKLIAKSSNDSLSLEMEVHIRQRESSSVYISNSLPVRFFRFIKKKPITSSVFALGCIALGLYAINTIQQKIGAHPWYYEYNIKNNSVVVFDKNDSKLWEKRVKEDVASINDFGASFVMYRTLTADVDNDGIKEVVSILSFAADENQSTKIRIFDGKGNTQRIYTIPFYRMKYKSKLYETEFYPTSIIFGGYTKQTLFVSSNNGRSPAVVIRYDEKGNILGTYWHYGQFTMFFFDVDHDGKNELILNGINDTEDETNRSFAATIILDPDKIIGNSESSATRGFGFPPSTAERYYVRYPNPEVMRHAQNNLGAFNSTNKSDRFLRVLNRTSFDQSSVAIEYFFDTTFAIKDVKFDSGFLIKHFQLFKEGKVTQPISDNYIRSLKEAVLYWNGVQWISKPTRITGSISLK